MTMPEIIIKAFAELVLITLIIGLMSYTFKDIINRWKGKDDNEEV